MSSRHLVEFICDMCAIVETFVHIECNQFGAVAKIDIHAALDARGWTMTRFEDSKLLTLNYCPKCSAKRKEGKPCKSLEKSATTLTANQPEESR